MKISIHTSNMHNAKNHKYFVQSHPKISAIPLATDSKNDTASKKNLAQQSSKTTKSQEKDTIITLDENKTYQSLIGFGGSFTEASAYLYSQADKKTKQAILQAYFGKNGLGYTLCRTHMQSCDFSLGNYSHVIDRTDSSLKTFSIERDTVYLIPFIKDALQTTTQTINIMATPWSPPPFMKTNDSMTYGGKLRKEYAAMWAAMYVKYIQAYKKEGISIWALSTQNEPEAVQTWDSCLYTADEEADFIEKHLVPALTKSKLSPKIIIWDHNRDKLYQRAKAIYTKKMAKHVWGAGFHWYEEISHGKPMHNNVAKTYKEFPEKHLVMTEGCQELFGGKVKMGDWSIGERYARNIIGDLNAGCEGWIDWNLLLDQRGGPNHVGNLCDAPVKFNTEKKELIYANSYYYIGHFSKFIAPGYIRINHRCSNKDLMLTTWKDPKEDTYVVVVLNTQSKKISYRINCHQQSISTDIPAHGIQTIIISQ